MTKRIARMLAVYSILLLMIGTAHSEEVTTKQEGTTKQEVSTEQQGPTKQEGTTEGTTYIAGIKTWTNNWKRQGPGLGVMESHSNLLIGWGAQALFSNRIFLEASYLMSFPYTYYIFNQTTPASERERTDFDVALGKQFHRYMAYFFGFRSTQIRERGTNYKETVAGPFFGIRGTLPLNNAVSLFGKLTYLPLSKRAVYTASTSNEWATGWFAAAGIKYDFTRRLSASLGYQQETSEGENTDTRDTFAGPTFDVMYVF